ncbi:MAG: hypothetical protein K6G23_06050, partial [Lachnospiraceae bacterium]|nr:hypothetical protein [Lachnospiraceae bacterium]
MHNRSLWGPVVVPLFLIWLWSMAGGIVHAEQSEQPTVPDETIVNQNVLFIASYGYDWQPTREQIAGMEKMLDQSV